MSAGSGRRNALMDFRYWLDLHKRIIFFLSLSGMRVPKGWFILAIGGGTSAAGLLLLRSLSPIISFEISGSIPLFINSFRLLSIS